MSTDAAGCVVCGGDTVTSTAVWHDDPAIVSSIRRCTSCGLLHIDGNEWDYDELGYGENSVSGPRVGTPDHRGREYYMASLAVDLVAGDDLEVLVLGSGLSYDWQHISELDRVKRVAVSDFDNLTGAPDFVPLDDRRERFDVIIACEVIEHIPDPMTDLVGVFGQLTPRGVFVGSTNLYDGTPLERHWYAFTPGHVRYHTPESLQLVAAAADASVDFRVPSVALQRAGRRKRYVLVTRDADVRRQIALWFAAHPFAPSEDDRREFEPHGA